MNTKDDISKAIILATEWLAGKFDKNREPIILHSMSVMWRVSGQRYDIDMHIAALLHDVIEDSGIPEVELRIAKLFGKRVADLVVELTRKEEETYGDYIRRVKLNPDATVIKIADLLENMRLDRPHAGQESLMKRYQKAMEILTVIDIDDDKDAEWPAC